jgi:general secretion pathway protein C
LGPDPVRAVEPTASPEPPPDARFQLLGLFAAQPGRSGVALIAVDGKPPRAFRVGAIVDGGHVLQAVDKRSAMLGPRGGATAMTLRLPETVAAASPPGLLPAAAGGPPPRFPDGRPGAVPMPPPSTQRPMLPPMAGNRPPPVVTTESQALPPGVPSADARR